jgi:inosine/xanthosine triphosphate pyrophosphatase family protein
VHAAVAGQPTHAITDDSGQIVAYVTALPGLNLDRYVNQAIGIQGLRGFLPQFQAAHIEAQNIVKLR